MTDNGALVVISTDKIKVEKSVLVTAGMKDLHHLVSTVNSDCSLLKKDFGDYIKGTHQVVYAVLAVVIEHCEQKALLVIVIGELAVEALVLLHHCVVSEEIINST